MSKKNINQSLQQIPAEYGVTLKIMTEYSAADIKTIDVDSHVVKNQGMYFGVDEASAEQICSNIMQGALILGIEKVQTQKIGNWNFICGSPDWFNISEIPFKPKSELFKGICAFPEAGVNSCRFEVMVRIFSKRAFSYSGKVIETISGNPIEKVELQEYLSKLGEWERIIGFQFVKKSVTSV